MDYIYLDNASTSFPKAPTVATAMSDYITNRGININRGSYALAYDVEDIIYTTRQRLNTLFNGHDPSHVIFTQNVTMSLNMVIKGLLKAGDHVLVSSMEHNAVMRPLTQLLDKGITFDTIPCDSTGSIQMDSIEPLIRPNTVALIINHASNVCGTIQPLESIGPICKAHNLQFIVDAAQTAGVIPIDVKVCHIDALCFTGHKGLLGPQGIGGIILTKEMAPIEEVKAAIAAFPGAVLEDDVAHQIYPQAINAVGSRDTFVGRIRKDLDAEKGIHMWVVSDNLLKGAAWNSVQIAETLHERGLVRPTAELKFELK